MLAAAECKDSRQKCRRKRLRDETEQSPQSQVLDRVASSAWLEGKGKKKRDEREGGEGQGRGAARQGQGQGAGVGGRDVPAQCHFASAEQPATTETMDPSTGTGSCGWMMGGACLGPIREGRSGRARADEPISENRPPSICMCLFFAFRTQLPSPSPAPSLSPSPSVRVCNCSGRAYLVVSPPSLSWAGAGTDTGRYIVRVLSQSRTGERALGVEIRQLGGSIREGTAEYRACAGAIRNNRLFLAWARR